MTKTYYVEGMTCEHCAASVTEEINEVPGTQGVDVDVASGRVTVSGIGFSDSQIESAVAEAGFSVKES